MSETIKKQIKFRIQRIETLQFAKLNEEIVEDKLSYAVTFGFGINPELFLTRAIFKYELVSKSISSAVIEVAVDFDIDPDCFESQFKKDDKLFIRKDFAVHLAVITVGTTRGVFHEKTKDSVLNKFVIPTIDVESNIKDDITFDI